MGVGRFRRFLPVLGAYTAARYNGRGKEVTAMKDVSTKKPLHVSTDGKAGPYIMVPVSQLDDVRRLLDRHRVRYSVDEDVVSLNGAPEVAVVDLGRGGDAKGVQKILDSAE
jgi:hypothetical protein